MSETTETEPKRRGPKPGFKRAVAAELRPAQRAPQREDVFVPRTAENRFEVDPRRKKPGMDIQWNVVSVYGAPAEEQIINHAANRWTPIPAYRHPELSGISDPNHPDAMKPIIRGGQRLDERPMHLTEAIRAADKAKADDQVSTQMQKLGLEARRTGARKTVKLERDFVPVSEDE